MASILERNQKVAPKKKTREEYAEDALYREVWEEVNNEKTIRFIKKYGRHMIAGALIAMIAIVGVQIGIKEHQARKHQIAEMYDTAVLSGDANQLAQMAEDAPGATADLALFQAYLLDKDVAKLERLASAGNTRDFRDLAKMHYVGVRGDEMTADQLREYLSSLDTKNSPFYYSASLTIAQKYLASGDRENANKWLDKIINDSDAPASIAGTAQTLR